MSSSVRISSFLAALAVAGAAQAADPPQGGALSNADPTRSPPPADASAPPRADPLPPASGSDGSGARFVLTGVVFDGASRPDLIDGVWRPYAGREVGAKELQEIAVLAEDAYDRAGLPYVSVRLQPQTVQDGVVRFRVLEGRVERLTVLGQDPIARRQAAGAFAPLKDSVPLTRAELESAFAEAGRIPGLSVTAGFGPTETPGGMDLVVQARRRPWSVYANVNNLYPEATGPWGVSLGLRHAGESPYGDALDLTLYTTADFAEQQAVRLGYRRRLDADGAEVGAALLYASGEPDPSITSISYATDVWLARIDGARPLWKGAHGRLDLGLALDWVDQKSQVSGSFTLSEDHLRVADLSLKAEWRGSWGTLRGDLHGRKGLDFGGASRSGDPDLSRAGGDPQAWLVRGRLEGESAGFGPVKLYARLEGQTTDDRLLFPEQYAGGNLTVGRGFEPGAVFADKALGGTVELRFGPFGVGSLGRLQPFVFYDRIALKTNDASPLDTTLESSGAGLRFEKPGRWRATLTWARPDGPPFVRESDSVLFDFTTSLDGVFGLAKGPRS